MVITASFARGAVRAAVERHAEYFTRFLDQLHREKLTPPSTLRRFPEWFRRRVAIHQRVAFLIVHGMVRRRSGVFVAFHPEFTKTDFGWNLGIYWLRFVVSPGMVDDIDRGRLPVEISGHALERMFQRTDAIEWRVIRECLAGATAFINAFASVYANSACRQCAVPAERGLLVGQIEDGTLRLRTFLPDAPLGYRWQALYDDLTRFVTANLDAINAAVLSPDDALKERFANVLRGGSHRWLTKPYVAEEDPMEDAWRSRGVE
jgi:hypothetical protein